MLTASAIRSRRGDNERSIGVGGIYSYPAGDFVEILSIAIGAISLLTTLSIKTISAIRGYDRAINQLGRDQERQAIAAQTSHDDIRADIADLRRDVDVVFSKMELTKSIASSPRYRSPSVAIED